MHCIYSPHCLSFYCYSSYCRCCFCVPPYDQWMCICMVGLLRPSFFQGKTYITPSFCLSQPIYIYIYIYYIEIYILCLNIYRLYPRNICFFLLHQPIYFIYMMIANFSFQAWIYIYIDRSIYIYIESLKTAGVHFLGCTQSIN